MTPQRWHGSDGDDLSRRPCPRCGTLAPVAHADQLEHLGLIGWQLFAEAAYAERCGHAQHFLGCREAAQTAITRESPQSRQRSVISGVGGR